MTTYWNLKETRFPSGTVTTTFQRRPAPDGRNFMGIGHNGEPQVIRPHSQKSTFEILELGPAEPPKFSFGQRVEFGKRGPRTVKAIVLSEKGWRYYVALEEEGQRNYDTWRLENLLAAV